MGIRSGYFKVVLAALIWGTIGLFTRWSGLSPLELAFYRVLIASLALFVILPKKQRLLILHTKHGLLIILAGILFALDSLLFFNALQSTSMSNAILPYNLQPVFMALLAPPLLNQKIRARNVVFFFLATAGVGVLLAPALIDISYADIKGIGYASTGAFLLALIAIIATRINIHAITFVYYEMLIATVCLLPFVKITGKVSAGVFALVLIIALVHTALAYILYYDALKTIRVQQVVVLTCLIPVVAALAGYLVFQEDITVFTIIGGLIIVVNGAVVALSNQ